jgi:tetratricopeptide (TPR) repeat protein
VHRSHPTAAHRSHPTAALALALCAVACGDRPAEPLSLRSHGRPVAVIGWDGADWEVVRPLLRAGRLPALGGLLQRGAAADLESMVPTLSPLLWTSVATGRPPEAHGILDFLEPDPGGGAPRPVGQAARRVPALWEMAAASGRSVGVVGWWATHPAQDLPGFQISDRLAYTVLEGVGGSAGDDGAAVRPAALRARASVVGPEEVPAEILSSLAPAGDAAPEAEADLRRLAAAALTYQRAALAGLRDGQPDLLMVYFAWLDQVAHRFVDCMPPPLASCPAAERSRFRQTLLRAYELQDRMLGDLLAALDPSTVVILLSDHGFLVGDRRPASIPPDVGGKPGRWHRQTGLFVVAGPEVAPGTELPPVELLEVAPTVLALLGLPVGGDMEGQPRLDALLPAARERLRPTRIPSWGARLEAPAVAAAGQDAAGRRRLDELRSLGYLSAAGERAAGARTVAAEVNLAARLVQVDRLDEAEAAAGRALERSPDYVPAWLARSDVRARQGRRAEAAAAVERAIGLDGGRDADPTLFLRWALLAGPRAGGGPVAAALEEALRRQPESADLAAAAGLILADRDPSSAGPWFARALDLQPSHREALAGLFAAAEAGAADAADLEARLRRALAAEPGAVMPRNWLALRIARRPGGAEEGLALLREARRLAPRHAGTLVNLGALLGEAGRLDEAAGAFRRALDLAADDVPARVGLATTLARVGSLGEARGVLLAAPEPARRDPRLLNTLAIVCRDLGDPEEAARAVRESLAADPDQPAARRMLRDLEGAG